MKILGDVFVKGVAREIPGAFLGPNLAGTVGYASLAGFEALA